MEYAQSKERFIEVLETLQGQWGVHKSIAQTPALRLIAPDRLTNNDLMRELKISRRNANLSFSHLPERRIVYKKSKGAVLVTLLKKVA